MQELHPLEAASDKSQSSEEARQVLGKRPGFLIRRLHQIHVALFLEECAEFGITPVQYSVMTALRDKEMDQKSLANSVGIDRATTTEVLRRLEKAGWLVKRKSLEDSRRRIATLTDCGRKLLIEIDSCAQRAHDRTVEPLTKAERARFIKYMIKLVDASNDYGRASLHFP